MDIAQPGADRLVGIGIGRLSNLNEVGGIKNGLKVCIVAALQQIDTAIDGNLPDGRANGSNADTVRAQRFIDPGYLLIGEIQYIRIPGTAQVQEVDLLAAERCDLFIQIWGNLVGEGRKANHDSVTSLWLRADS